MKTAIPWILFIIASATAFYFWNQLQTQEATESKRKSELLAEVAHLKANTLRRDSVIQEMARKSDSTTVSNKRAQNASKEEIRVLRKRERGLRIDTVTMTLVDTIFARQDSLILAVELDRDRISRECHAIADSLTAQANDFEGIGLKQEERAQIAETQLSREKGKARWLKRGLIILGAAWLFREATN